MRYHISPKYSSQYITCMNIYRSSLKRHKKIRVGTYQNPHGTFYFNYYDLMTGTLPGQL